MANRKSPGEMTEAELEQERRWRLHEEEAQARARAEQAAAQSNEYQFYGNSVGYHDPDTGVYFLVGPGKDRSAAPSTPTNAPVPEEKPAPKEKPAPEEKSAPEEKARPLDKYGRPIVQRPHRSATGYLPPTQIGARMAGFNALAQTMFGQSPGGIVSSGIETRARRQAAKEAALRNARVAQGLELTPRQQAAKEEWEYQRGLKRRKTEEQQQYDLGREREVKEYDLNKGREAERYKLGQEREVERRKLAEQQEADDLSTVTLFSASSLDENALKNEAIQIQDRRTRRNAFLGKGLDM